MGDRERESRLDTLCCLIGRILSKGQEKGKRAWRERGARLESLCGSIVLILSKDQEKGRRGHGGDMGGELDCNSCVVR